MKLPTVPFSCIHQRDVTMLQNITLKDTGLSRFMLAIFTYFIILFHFCEYMCLGNSSIHIRNYIYSLKETLIA